MGAPTGHGSVQIGTAYNLITFSGSAKAGDRRVTITTSSDGAPEWDIARRVHASSDALKFPNEERRDRVRGQH
jgi:uncharacterized membrane protein